MTSRILILFGLLFGLAAGSAAQQACKAIEVPVGVISASGETFRGLSAADFAGRASKGSVAVRSIVFDDGPRRVLFVVDTSKKLSANTRKAEIELIDTLTAASRPEDSLALITARGPGGEVKFGENRSGLAQALSQSGSGHGKDWGVLDAVLEGIDWFSEPRPGDAIVVIAADLDGNHKASPKTVAKALGDHHIRMFGLALGLVTTKSTVATRTVTSTVSQGLAQTTPLTGAVMLATGDENFFPLTANSGGLLLSVVNGDPGRSYNMDDPKLRQQVKQKGQAVLNMISSFYRAQIEPPQLSHPEDWTLDVTENIRKHEPAMWVLYPRELGPC
jgi:hypothetical protein